MVNDLRQAAEQALEALIWGDTYVGAERKEEAIAALRAVLAEPQEPVAFLQFLTDVVTAAGLLSHGKTDKALAARINDFAVHLRTAPQPAKRVPLTEDEAKAIAYVGPVYAPDGVVTRHPQEYRKELEQHRLDAIRRTEAAHGINVPQAKQEK